MGSSLFAIKQTECSNTQALTSRGIRSAASATIENERRYVGLHFLHTDEERSFPCVNYSIARW